MLHHQYTFVRYVVSTLLEFVFGPEKQKPLDGRRQYSKKVNPLLQFLEQEIRAQRDCHPSYGPCQQELPDSFLCKISTELETKHVSHTYQTPPVEVFHFLSHLTRFGR